MANKNRQDSFNDFMGGYKDDTYSNFNPFLGAFGGLGGSSLGGASGGAIGGGIAQASGGIAQASGGGIGSMFSKLKLFSGAKKNVRLFAHCLQDNSFANGWMEEVSPIASKVVRLRLGKLGSTKNEQLSAVYVPNGYNVILHEHRRGSSKFLSGKHKILFKSSSCLSSKGFNDMVSEIDIVPEGFMGGILKSWKKQIGSLPVEIIGNYASKSGGSSIFSSWVDRVKTQIANGNRPTGTVVVGPNRPIPVRPDRPTGSVTVKHPDGTETVIKNPRPTGRPNRPTGRPLASPDVPQKDPGNGNDVAQDLYVGDTYTASDNNSGWTPSNKSPLASSKSAVDEEEDSLLENPLLWVGVSLVLIAGVYIIMSKKKTRSFSKTSRGGLKTKRSGRIK